MTTTNQNDDTICAPLAKRIAELDPNWAVAGMCCRDPANNGHWRKTGGGSWCWDDDGGWPGGPSGKQGADSLDAAIAAGPDWHDRATIGAMLLSLGDEIHVERDFDNGKYTLDAWANGKKRIDLMWFCCLSAAVLAAKIVQLEANHAA